MTPEDLRVVRILSGLSDERLRWLAERGEELYLESGDWLFRADDRPEKFYVQLDGQLEAGGEVDGCGPP